MSLLGGEAGSTCVTVGAVDCPAAWVEAAQGYPGSELDCILYEMYSLPGTTPMCLRPSLVTA